MPVEMDFRNPALRDQLFIKDEAKVFVWKNYLRGTLTIQGKSKEAISSIFNNFIKGFQQLQPQEKEPMLNILAYVENEEWVVHVYPRILHRPRQYFETDHSQILLSPASVDMGGVFITPREEDFDKITSMDVSDILSQVCMDSLTLEKIVNF